ncbi:hypothetical protein V3H21_12940 [Vibrio parahaemolyticus]|uniref:hypothetical protein n=1 Tax=Vibrio parahaemolyticus TaxID=670 RepID=UPI000B78D9ED|nr:hypothetical protein [Vibrio parahaemolyticus]EHR0247272.1 hypothetical protein [Vibrio parahaemolyticus]EIO4560509.1 hypothetical protein [Vibrio parahaemolyticus]ELA8153282.1 hypothetical protein [Vibrio parahaemolyticus]ELU9053232.1 hypothetical protein [Vibrio parahaemolyticus]MBE4498093.1 hypothetical protein [Vibrio parahaemolyticus]
MTSEKSDNLKDIAASSGLTNTELEKRSKELEQIIASSTASQTIAQKMSALNLDSPSVLQAINSETLREYHNASQNQFSKQLEEMRKHSQPPSIAKYMEQAGAVEPFATSALHRVARELEQANQRLPMMDSFVSKGVEYPVDPIPRIETDFIQQSHKEKTEREEKVVLNLENMYKEQKKLIDLTIQAQNNEAEMAKQADRDKKRSFAIAIISLLVALLSAIPSYIALIREEQYVIQSESPQPEEAIPTQKEAEITTDTETPKS